MVFVGLTGGIGSGKSEALSAFERLGVPTLSTDAVVHDLLGADEVRDLLRERWGDRVVAGDDVDRAAVASIVFDRPEELSWLEATIFPLVGERMAAWRAKLERDAGPDAVAVVEVPLLFEAGIEAAFDGTVAVVSDEALRAERAAARGHEGVEGRTGRQLPQDEKAQRADHVIRNDGTIEDLEEAVREVLAELRGRVSG
ncbi:MAG: dephospho-CoA kinase [Solirubrobacterales bacterium]